MGLRHVSGLTAALLTGLVFFVVINYLSLFGITGPSSIVSEEWVLIAIGVLIGYAVSWAAHKPA
ncbi:hypothetical protein [Halobaculum marinum]|uniref:PEP-CTERM protein-sorting domain-containing protein n=1 Tax=Halobaculum marinum TaxID=3031996 RepID=A0ABD5WVP6_9EURY|nr:hypothetical protein [Halobaculum sp. DT55]